MTRVGVARRIFTVVAWLVIGVVVVPHVVGTGAEKLDQLDYILTLMMVACGLNIVLGLAGQLFLGPSALLATGAYTAAVLAEHSTIFQSLPMMCVVAVIAAVVVGTIAAIPALRIGGFYLGMVTLFAALVIPDVASNLSLTGGDSGISLVTILSFTQRPSGIALYYVGTVMVALMAGYVWLVKNSRLGRRFGAIAASEILAQSVGIRPYQTKLVAFMLGAVPCGLAGAFYVYSQQFISPDSVSPTLSITILAGMVIGGGGTIVGPLIGTALIGATSQFLGSFEEYEGIVYGVALVGVAVGLPVGLMGLYDNLLSRFRDLRAVRRGVPTADSLRPDMAPTDAQLGSALTVAANVRDGDLVVRGVSRSFGGVRALDGVDITVERGTVHALVGPNGSGKTTLLNLVSGFYRVEQGTISVGEQRLENLPAAEIARLGVARTFQTPKLLAGGSALDNVFVGADHSARGSLVAGVLHTPGARANDRESLALAASSLWQTGLAGFSSTSAELIPHGTQRLLEIARAIALRPAFVLLDEPAAGLSPAEAEMLTAAVRSMAKAGFGVLLVEHNLPVVFGLADTVTVLHQGKVIARGSPTDVASDAEVVRVYLGRQGGGPPASTSAPKEWVV